MNITFTVNYTGAPDADDNLAAQHLIFLENQRRAVRNEQIVLNNVAAVKENLVRAAQSPPGVPVPILPAVELLKFSTPTDVKNSHLEIVTTNLINQHFSDIKLAKSINGIAARYTKEETERIFANLTSPLNRGVLKGDIIEDTDAIALKPAP